MLPAAVFFFGLFAYVALTVLVLALAVVLAIPRQTRSFAKKLAAGMCGSWPGVFVFQILAVPVGVLVLLMLFVVEATIQPSGGWDVATLVVFWLVVIGVFAIASLAGFYTGWRTAWEFAAGRPLREFLSRDRLLGPVVRLLRHLPLVRRVL